MKTDVLKHRNYVDDEILQRFGLPQAADQYARLLQRLYPNQDTEVSARTFERLLTREGNLLVFRVVDDTMVSTAQATLIPVEPTWQAVVSNVITLRSYGRQGHGIATMQKLLQLIDVHWGECRDVNVVLTNNKSKGNAGFYTDNGTPHIWAEVPTTLYAYVGGET